jgi:acyl-coenzyme A synthetase/AMP-(fatty) acid ligase
MTKSIDVLPTWYWPDGVPRYSSMPRVSVHDRVVRRWSRRRGDAPALTAGAVTLDYGALDVRTAAVAARIGALTGISERRVAIVTSDPGAGALVLLGALRAGAHALPLDPSVDRTDALDAFGAHLVVHDRDVDAGGDVPSITLTDALEAIDDAELPEVRHDPGRLALSLVDAGRLVHHSEVSILRAAHAFAAFFSLSQESRVQVDLPFGTWEHVVGLLAPLEAGGVAVFAARDLASDATDAVDAHTGPASLRWIDETTAARWAAGSAPRADRPAMLLVSVAGPFPLRARRHLRRATGGAVLTIYGTPATGPIAASAPAWHLDDPVGIPMTDVDLVPIDPRTRSVAVGPWVLLAHAGIAVKTPALAVGIEAQDPPTIVDDTYYTGATGRIDANGMLYLLGQAGDRPGASEPDAGVRS